MFLNSHGKLVVVLMACAVVLAAVPAGACVGARPLAMGGAFTGLADDTNATYWNPAGLVQLQGLSTTYMRTTTNRDEINYQDFLSVAMPIQGMAAVGVSWIRDNLLTATNDIDQEDWYWISLAYQVRPGTSVGLNIKTIENSIPGLETDMGLDVGLFHQVDAEWAVGLLVQDANEPEISDSHGPIAVWARNWRPGVSFRPDSRTIVSAELYDAFDDLGVQSLRVGYEKKIRHGWALRAGYYGLGMEDGSAFTFGFGKTSRAGTLRQPYDLSMDLAAMVGDLNAVLTSISVRF